MFGIGSTELLVIILVALVVLGPKSLTGITRSLGKAVGEFRRVSTEFQRTLNAEVDQAAEEDRKKTATTAARATETPQGSPAPGEAAAARTDRENDQTPPGQRPRTAAHAEEPRAASSSPMPAFDAVPQPPSPPAGSPLAQALAKTHADASGTPTAQASKPTDGAA